MNDGEARKKPRYFVTIKRGSRELYYWQPSKQLRADGHLQRRLAEKTGDLDQAYDEAEALNKQLDAERAAAPTRTDAQRRGTMAWLIAEYERDRRYLKLKKVTRDSYDVHLRFINRLCGPVAVAKIGRPYLEQLYNRLHATNPWKANAVMRMFNRLLFCAWTYGEIAINPAQKMELAGNPPRDEIWEAPQLDYIRRMAVWLERPSVAIAGLLGAELGQRVTDILALRWAQYDGRAIELKQSKTAKPIKVVCTIELKALLDDARAALERRAAAAGTVALPTHIVVSEATAQPYDRHHFAHTFADIRACAEIDGLRFQDMRRTCVVNLARASATPPEIAAITGHEIDRVVKILETYLPRDAIMAEHAIVKLEEWKRQAKTGRERGV